MQREPLVSFAQNREDVVLYRALHGITRGRYLDVGANHPVLDSVTKVFYDRGWRGLSIDPVPAYADAHREQRSGDLVAQVAVTDADVETIEFHSVPGTGLSSLDADLTASHARTGRGQVETIVVEAKTLTAVLDEADWQDEPIHFMNLDVEGAEGAVLRSLDLQRYRPWVMVIESLTPDTAQPAWQAWESLLTGNGYTFTLFDGLSRFYVADEHAELTDALSVPANVLDNYLPAAQYDAAMEAAGLRDQVFNLTAERDRLVAERTDAAQAQQAERDWLREQLEVRRAQSEDLEKAWHHQEGIAGRLQSELDSAKQEVSRLEESTLEWRTKAVGAWADYSAYRASSTDEISALRAEADAARADLAEIRASTSWRVTKPLRALKQQH